MYTFVSGLSRVKFEVPAMMRFILFILSCLLRMTTSLPLSGLQFIIVESLLGFWEDLYQIC